MVWTDHMTLAYVENCPLSCGTGPLATPAAPFGCREIPYRSVPRSEPTPYAASVAKRLLRVTGLRPKNHDSAIAYKSSTHYHELRSAHARTPLPVPM